MAYALFYVTSVRIGYSQHPKKTTFYLFFGKLLKKKLSCQNKPIEDGDKCFIKAIKLCVLLMIQVLFSTHIRHF